MRRRASTIRAGLRFISFWSAILGGMLMWGTAWSALGGAGPMDTGAATGTGGGAEGMGSGIPGPVTVWAADPLATWHRVELGWIREFQGDGRWGGLMVQISRLGPGKVMVVLILGVMVVGDPRLGLRLLVLMLLTLWLRDLAALLIGSPRPFWLDPTLRTFGDSATTRPTYGFPSGHSVVGAALWVYGAAEVRRRWAWGVAVLVIVGIGVSRVYLGVHFITDVLAGWTLGAVLVGIFRWAEPRLIRRWTGAGAWVPVGWAAGGAALILMTGWVAAQVAGRVPANPAWGEYGHRARETGVYLKLGGSLLGVAVLAVVSRKWWDQVGWRGLKGRFAKSGT